MTTLALNATEAIQPRVVEGRVPRYGPLLALVSRSAFILLFQGVTFLILRQLNVSNAEVALRNWWPVYGTLADLGCLAILFWLTKREGIRLFDLIGVVMFLTFVPLTITMELIYLHIRRLPPLIVAHWLMDLSNVLFLFQAGYPLLFNKKGF